MTIRTRILTAASAALMATSLLAAPAMAEQIGEVGVDWLGNDILIDAVSDPKVQGVTCHVAYFDRGLIDRLQKGNWFEDPSNASIACRQTGPITISDIDLDENGEVVFKESRSLIWKSLVVNRIYDRINDTLVYLINCSRSRRLRQMALSTCQLYRLRSGLGKTASRRRLSRERPAPHTRLRSACSRPDGSIRAAP